jgi:DNA-binding transcriptional LysR family regulator
MRVDTLTSIKVFRQVVESGSFVAAADRLDMSTAMVSKHVMHIEKRIGVRLLNRNNRTLSLTEPGRVYFERCKTILDDLEQTELELGSLNTAPRGTLKITAPGWFAGQRSADLLAAYRNRYPDIVVDMSFEDRLVDIVEEGYDLAMRVSKSMDSLPAGFVARPIHKIHFRLAATRQFLKKHGTPKSPDDLANFDCVSSSTLFSWTMFGPSGQVEAFPRTIQRYRTMVGLPNALAAGLGIGPLPDLLFDDPVLRDVLVPVLPEYSFIGEQTLFLVYVSRQYVPLKIRTFIDHMVESHSKSEAKGVKC